MTEFYCVRDDKSFCEGVNHLEAAVVFKSWADAEPFASTECPGQTFVGVIVDDDRTAAGADGRCVEVEWRVVVRFPSRQCWGYVRLSEEVERELGLGYQHVPEVVGKR
jgi:hypothetical protein